MGDDAITWVMLLLSTFMDLSKHRSVFQGGVNSINLGDLEVYLRLNNLELHHIELDILFRLDALFMSHIRERAEESIERAKKGN